MFNIIYTILNNLKHLNTNLNTNLKTIKHKFKKTHLNTNLKTKLKHVVIKTSCTLVDM